jgi:hypothetical protein
MTERGRSNQVRVVQGDGKAAWRDLPEMTFVNLAQIKKLNRWRALRAFAIGFTVAFSWLAILFAATIHQVSWWQYVGIFLSTFTAAFAHVQVVLVRTRDPR